MERNPFDWLEHQAELADDHEHGLSGGQAEHSYQHIQFTPVPRLRARRRGWSEGRQRAFIFALSRCGSVARSSGLGPGLRRGTGALLR